MIFLLDSFYVEVRHIESAGATDVNAIDAHEGVNDKLTAIG